MSNVKFYKGGDMPLELHKVRVVQKLHLVPIERRMEALIIHRQKVQINIPIISLLVFLSAMRRVLLRQQYLQLL